LATVTQKNVAKIIKDWLSRNSREGPTSTEDQAQRRKKAAALLITLGPDLAAKVYQHLKEETVEQITLEIANLRKITPEEKDSVLEEVINIATAQEYISQGGVEYAHEILEKALGPNKAMEIINRLQGSLQMTPFDYIKRPDPQQL
jgi:flagellar motor switch protein FliG